MSKYFWYGRLAETTQRITVRNQQIDKSEYVREIIFNQNSATNELRRSLIEHIKKKANTENLFDRGWSLYFSFGKNVNKRDMLTAKRAPEAKFIMADYIDNHKFIIDERGVASISPAPGRKAWGVLWIISPQDLANLDRVEGINRGFYRRETINTALFTTKAEVMGGATQDEAQAYIYLSNYPEGSVAREGYIEGIIEGLREAAVPEEFFKYYETYIPNGSEVNQVQTKLSDSKTQTQKPKPKESSPIEGFLPADTSLPFFAYGIFKEGELGFDRIQEITRFVEDAFFQHGALLERDGLPLLVDTRDNENRDNDTSGVVGDLIIFHEKNALDGYKRIQDIEPESQYKWGVVEIRQTDFPDERCLANTLVGRRPNVGTAQIHDNCWSINQDPFFRDVIKFCKEKATDDSNAIVKQAALLMAWSALERISAIKYSLKANPEQRISMIGQDGRFLKALATTEKAFGQSHPFRPIQDTRSTRSNSKKTFLFSKPAHAIDYLYQIRNNISHRGKAGYESDMPIIVASLNILVLTIENLLDLN